MTQLPGVLDLESNMAALIANPLGNSLISCGWVCINYPSGAKQAAEKLEISSEIECPSGAKARANFAGFMRGLKPPPPSEIEFFRNL